MLTATDIVWSIVIPAIIGLVIGIVCWRPWRRGRAHAWAGPLAMGVGFFVAFPAIQNSGSPWRFPAITPRESTEWLPWIAVLATVLALFSLIIPAARWVWAIIVLIATATACGMMLKFKFAHTWSPIQGGEILLAFAIAATIWWAILEAFGEQDPISASILHWLIGSCSAITLMLTGCLTYGKFTFPLAGVAGAVLVLSIWRREKVRMNGLPMVFSIVLIAVLAGGFYLSYLTLPLLQLILCSPVAAILSMLLPTRIRFWQRLAIRIILAAIPLAAAVSMAAIKFHHDQQQESNYMEE